jgi:hypothetical protein
MKYIGLDGKEYSSIDEVTRANREVRAHPLYVREMRRRAVINRPGEITREEWRKILTDAGEISKETEELMEKALRKSVDEAVKDPRFVKDAKDLVEGKVVKKTYNFQISGLHRSILKSANRRGIPFELNGEQIESLMEKKCHFCGSKSETVITLGEKYEYKDSKGVCVTCGEVHDLLGARMTPWLDSIIENIKH